MINESNKPYDHDPNEDYKPQWGKTIVICLFYIVLMAIHLWLFASCVKDDDAPRISHVLLVYLGGDNNLSAEADDKLQAIARGHDGAPCRKILVYKDTRGDSPCLIEIGAKNKITTLAHYDTENSADPEVFRRVILDAKSMYPEASLNLLVFSHASGWLPGDSFGKPSLRSILTDGDKQMELSDFSSAIPDGMFRYIIFEMCHMAGIEVAYQLKDKAQYIIASSAEIVSPGFTNLYEENARELLSGNPQTFIEKAFNHCDSQSGWQRSASFSVIQTDKLIALAEYVKAHCKFDLEANTDITSVQHFDRGTGYLFSDFEDHYSRLLATEGEREEFSALINDCVVWKAATPSFLEGYNGFSIDKHSGLTSYIPQSRYPNLNESYTALDWYKVTR